MKLFITHLFNAKKLFPKNNVILDLPKTEWPYYILLALFKQSVVPTQPNLETHTHTPSHVSSISGKKKFFFRYDFDRLFVFKE